jgi:hypothetical protein
MPILQDGLRKAAMRGGPGGGKPARRIPVDRDSFLAVVRHIIRNEPDGAGRDEFVAKLKAAAERIVEGFTDEERAGMPS